MTATAKTYPAKLLLFGEYAVLRGAPAWAAPYLRYTCHWEQCDTAAAKNQQYQLTDWANVLQAQAEWHELGRQFAGDLERGCYLHSTLPLGYGLGSSGSLCAAVYDRYRQDSSSDIPFLRQQLAQLEHYFHGNSSGIDPLVSYLQQAILLRDDTLLEMPLPRLQDYHLFLVDTGQARQTAPLVADFLQRCQESDYCASVDQQLVPATGLAIDRWLQGDEGAMFKAWRSISAWQWTHQRHLIPVAQHAHWSQGLTSDYWSLKLCGAGGGGFLLGCVAAGRTDELAAQIPLIPIRLDEAGRLY